MFETATAGGLEHLGTVQVSFSMESHVSMKLLHLGESGHLQWLVGACRFKGREFGIHLFGGEL